MERSNYSRSCANKLGGGWEREKVQRAAKRNEDDDYSKAIGLRLLLRPVVTMAANVLPSQTTKYTPNDNNTII